MFRVFIISNHLMFSQGLENLLRQDTDLKIIGQETNTQNALEQIKILQPEVVIIYSDDAVSSSRAIIVEILKTNPETKVLGLNLQNNTFYVYQAVQGETTTIEDLFRAIKGTGYQSNLPTPNKPELNNRWSEVDRPQ